jgi:hypothetical protein
MPPRHKTALLSENRILASLPEADYQRMLPDLKPVSLKLGDIIYEADEAIRHVYMSAIKHMLYSGPLSICIHSFRHRANPS